MRTSPIAVAIMAVAACGGTIAPAPTTGRPPSPASPTTPLPQSTTLRYSPGVTKYLITQRHHVDQQLPTGDQVQEIGLKTYVTAIIIDPADARGYSVSLTIDSILADSATVLPPTVDLQSARGLRYDGRLSPSGQLIDPKPSDGTVAKNLAQLFGGFRTFFPKLPPAGVAPGVKWSDSTEATDTTGTAIVVDRSVSHYTTGDWESPSGVRQLGIEVSGDFTVSGSGAAGGATFALSGTGTHAGKLQFSAAGRFLGGSTVDSAGIVITFDPQGMAIPRHQVSRTTIAVLP
ncbi:MAG TPA: hypothetical protein VEV39_09340 [Gemmatimonadales bacterium]|nr:hypothetical protein [Gemmatimonadales bacterium]